MKLTHSIHRNKLHPHKWMSEGANKWVQQKARAKRAMQSKQMSKASERATRGVNGPVLYASISYVQFQSTVPWWLALVSIMVTCLGVHHGDLSLCLFSWLTLVLTFFSADHVNWPQCRSWSTLIYLGVKYVHLPQCNRVDLPWRWSCWLWWVPTLRAAWYVKYVLMNW